jgi:hypothetical protein
MRYTVRVTAGEVSRTDGDATEMVEVATEVVVSSTSHGEAESEAVAQIGDWIRAYWRAEEHGEKLAEPDRWKWDAEGEVLAGVLTRDMDVDELKAVAIDCEPEGYDPRDDF